LSPHTCSNWDTRVVWTIYVHMSNFPRFTMKALSQLQKLEIMGVLLLYHTTKHIRILVYFRVQYINPQALLYRWIKWQFHLYMCKNVRILPGIYLLWWTTLLVCYMLCNTTHYREWEEYNIVNCHSSICIEKMTPLPIQSVTMELCVRHSFHYHEKASQHDHKGCHGTTW
jgi:hypothetical protein